jgi:hypothetical protein
MVSDVQYRRSECILRKRQWTLDTHAKIEMEASGLLGKFTKMAVVFV